MTDKSATTAADQPPQENHGYALALADYFPKFDVKPAILTKKDNLKGMLAEFLATALFVWVGCGTAVSMQAQQFNFEGPASDNFVSTVAMAFGFGIAVLAYAIAPISGGHINPAVTMALFMVKNIGPNRLLGYTLAQFAGAFFGALVLWGCTVSDELTNGGEDNPPFKLASNFLTPSVTIGNAFLLESVGTFLLVFTVLFTAVYKKNIADNMAPAAIGWSVMLAHMVLIPFTGCGINPARSFGPHLVSIFAGVKIGVRGWWIYYTAPYVGAFFAAMLFKTIYQSPPEHTVETAPLVPGLGDKISSSIKHNKPKGETFTAQAPVDTEQVETA